VEIAIHNQHKNPQISAMKSGDIRVFAQLIYDGYLKLEDLEGLSEEKLEMIKRMAELF